MADEKSDGEKAKKIVSLLPKENCGKCGFDNCGAFAVALVAGKASPLDCHGPIPNVKEICETYRIRRDALVSGLERVGWNIKSPKGTMFVWAKIPEKYLKMGSVEFSKLLINEAQVAVSPGLGFGEYGDEYVRFALIENKMRINQAVRGIKKIL